MTVYGTRNSVLVGATILPGLGRVPRDASPELKRYLEALQETIEVRNGQRGDPRDRAVTLRELIDSGLAKELESTPFDPNNPTTENIGFTTPTTNTDPETPTAPTSFVVTSGYASISLRWDYPFTYRGHSLTEVWRHTSDSLGNATFIGQSGGTTFVDPIGSGSATQYYWVRHVNDDGIAGPFNASSGTTGTTATDVNVLLTSLSSSITSSQLASSLATPIGNLPANTNASFTAVTNTTNALGAQYTVKINTTSGNNAHVTGFGLATETVSGTTTSAFIVAANKFAVIDPTTYTGGLTQTPASGVVPFAVTSAYTDSTTGLQIDAGVYMNTAFINKATVSTLLAGSIVGDFIKASVVMDAPHIHAGTINIGSITKTDANNPRTWTHGGTNRTGNFSVDANGIMHCQGATIKRQSDGAVVFDASELNGVYIKDASVDTLSIAGNAVTVPAGDAATGLSDNVGSSYVAVGSQGSGTALANWASNAVPGSLILGGRVGYQGNDTSGAVSGAATGAIKLEIEWRQTDGSYQADATSTNSTQASQSFARGFGGQVVTVFHVAVPATSRGARITIVASNSNVEPSYSNFRRVHSYGFFALAAKR